MQPNNNNYYIRPLIDSDIPQILAIEQKCFEKPWDESELKACLKQRGNFGDVATPSTRDKTVLGYIIRQSKRESLSIVNLAVDPEHQKKGVATSLVNYLIPKIQTTYFYQRDSMQANVREGNDAAVKFFKKMHFVATNIEHGYYDDPSEDYYVMQYFLDKAAEKAAVDAFQLRLKETTALGAPTIIDPPKPRLILPPLFSSRHLLFDDDLRNIESVQFVLRNMTGIAWNTVNAAQEPIAVSIESDINSIYLRTERPVFEPAKAYHAISHFFGKATPPEALHMIEPSHITIPLDWVRRAHVDQAIGKNGEMIDLFSESSLVKKEAPQPQETTLSFDGGEVVVHKSARRYTFILQQDGKQMPTTFSYPLPHDFEAVTTAISTAIAGEKTTLGAMQKIAEALENLKAL